MNFPVFARTVAGESPASTDSWRSYISHLECSATGERRSANQPHGLSPTGKPLLARYALDRARAEVDRDAIASRAPDMWRYRELLPVRCRADLVSLGETVTPLIAIGDRPGHLFVKDESRLPTGSFKARGQATAMSMVKSFGHDTVAIPTNGNAGGAAAAYAARAGIHAWCFCPIDTPDTHVAEMRAYGASVFRVDGRIDDCGAIVREGRERMGWFPLSTMQEPYRVEGKKTMGFELAEQFGWELPDTIIYATGGGTALVAMWKAFDELEALGWISSARPRMIAAQSTGCAPLVRAFAEEADTADYWDDAETFAAGIRVPCAIADFLILDLLRASGGWAEAVTDAAIRTAATTLARCDGLMMCPEGAATYAVYEAARARGDIHADERVVLFNGGTGLKYPMPADVPLLDAAAPIAWDDLARHSPRG